MSNRNLLTIVIVLLVGIIALLVFKEPAQPDIGDTAEHVSETFREVVAELDHNGQLTLINQGTKSLLSHW